MKDNLLDKYKNHFASFKRKYLKDFEDDLSHAPNKQYFITKFQEKVNKAKTNIYRISDLHSKISEIDNQLELNDRITFIELVTKLCKDENRDLLQTLFHIAEIKALDEIWLIANKKRKLYPEIVMTTKVVVNKFTKSQPQTDSTLQSIFIDSNKFDYVIKQLVAHEFCSANPLIWIPQQGANKQILCALLYLLWRKKYFNLNKFPSNDLLIAVAKNTFSVPISKSTLKIKALSKYQHLFHFLKDSSEIK